jgi:phosphoribosylformylglycinamidine cyclo-ligase
MTPDRGRDAGRPLTYAEAGVDIAAGEKAVELIKAHVRSTFRPEVVGDIGGFGGLFAFDPKRFEHPLLVSSTDGVGTKSMIARLTGRYDTIGIDLVAMSVDDIAVQGAEPLFFLDYISIGKLVPEIVDDIVGGVAHGCVQAGCALLGGEMSEHPDLMEPGEFDLVGFAVGVVERARALPSKVKPGDAVVGFASPGLRCNGYALARRALLDRAGRHLDDPAWSGAHHSLADELIRPSVIYAPAMRKLREKVDVHAFAHITGGGLPDNLARVLPPHCDVVLRRGEWEEPRIFREIQAAGDVADDEMVHVFNLGLGMVAVVDARDRFDTVDVVRAAGQEAWIVGEVSEGRGRVSIARK